MYILVENDVITQMWKSISDFYTLHSKLPNKCPPNYNYVCLIVTYLKLLK